MNTVLHLCCGSGGGALGFQRAGFHGLAAIDLDQRACTDYERMIGEPATCADLFDLEPADLRSLAGESPPDVVFTSAPCKGFSGCLPESRSVTPKYMRLNELAFRAVWLALEAWADDLPPLVLFENVPRIQSRGRAFLDRIAAMLRGYGYGVDESVHDCGELGGLAQRRRRLLLAARLPRKCGALLRVPPTRRVRSIGEVLGELPVPLPVSTKAECAGGPMHRLGMLSTTNWIRLALIPAGKDWRAIPDQVRLVACGRNGPYGVEDWNRPAHSVVGVATPRNTWGTVADPRLSERGDPSTDTTARHTGKLGVEAWDRPSHTIIAAAEPALCRSAVVADPRVHTSPRRGAYGVQNWAEPSHVVVGHHRHDNSPGSVADPRVPGILGPGILGPELDIEDKRPLHLVIKSLDGTWHRPMTTLELAALQGFPVRGEHGEWLMLDGNSHKRWRAAIGNAVPPPAAEAIGRACAAALAESREGSWRLGAEPIWVRHRVRRPGARRRPR